MTNAFGIIFGILAVAAIMVLLDSIGRRKDRQSRKPTA